MGLSLYTIFSSASEEGELFSATDLDAIQRVDEFVIQHEHPDQVMNFLKSIMKKNLWNDRVQRVLGAVVWSEIENEIDEDQDELINARLEDVLTTLSERREEKKLWLDELAINNINDAPPTRGDLDPKGGLDNLGELEGNMLESDNEIENEDENVVDNEVVEQEEQEKEKQGQDQVIEQEVKVLAYEQATQRPSLPTQDFDQKFAKLVTEWVYDERAVEQARLWWVNVLRAERWLDLMTTDFKLRETARDWSMSLRDKQVADHKRELDSVYYDYPAITQWFADRGVVFENHSGATSTENIGRARHTCPQVKPGEDCTQEVIADLRRIFDYFAAEESYNGVHWRTMIHPKFLVVWVSFAPGDDDKVYAVMHYGTKVIE